MRLIPTWGKSPSSKKKNGSPKKSIEIKQEEDEEERGSNHIYAMFEHSKPSPRLSKREYHAEQSPRVNWKKEGLLTTIPVRIAEGIRIALDALDNDEASLRSEGLWRECGETKCIQSLVKAFADMGVESKDIVLRTLRRGEVHSVTGAIKAALRNHQPLTTYSRCDAFVHLLNTETSHRHEKMQKLLREVPAINRQLLGRLAFHLNKVASRDLYNRMTLENLGIALGPTLLRRYEQFETDLFKAKEHASTVATATVHLIQDLAPVQSSKNFQDEQRESAVDRSVRLRLTDQSQKHKTSAQLEANLTCELAVFGSVVRLGLKPRNSGQEIEGVVLFDTSQAAVAALRIGQTASWSVRPIAAATPRAKEAAAVAAINRNPLSSPKQKANNYPHFVPENNKNARQRIKRAFISKPLAENFEPSARAKPWAYSMNDIGLVMDEERALANELFCENKVLTVGSAHW